MKQISVNEPIFFESNRVQRVYRGGALFANFFGDNSVDGFEPEEWIASTVAAINRESKCEKEGVSRIRGTDVFFDQFLRTYKKELLGDREAFGILTKILDSAIRLPVQAHPDKAFSRKYFHSEYGKTECWVVLATRPGASLYFGFNRQITKEEFAEAVEKSRADKSAMDSLLNQIDVKAGDVFLVPARMVHAIGYGCLILEIQEPTDFTVQPEYWCGDYKLNEQEMYIGLDKDTALQMFDYDTYGDAAVAMGEKEPKVTNNENGVCVEELITYEDTPCFAVQRYTVEKGRIDGLPAPAVYVVTEGEGTITAGEQAWDIKKGDYFFLPYGAKEKSAIYSESKLQIVACLPPKN